MLRQAHQFVEFTHAGEGGGGRKEREAIFVKILQHLAEGIGVVRVETENLLLGASGL